MGTDEGDLTYIEIGDFIGERASRGGAWVCVEGLGDDKKIVGRGTNLDDFVEVMAKDYIRENVGFSIGRIDGKTGEIEIPVLCSQGIGDYYNRFNCLNS